MPGAIGVKVPTAGEENVKGGEVGQCQSKEGDRG